MLQLLSRRWWGVTGWGYLLSLGLAVGMYWMLLGSYAVHHWTFERPVQIKGLTDDLESLVIKQVTSEDTKYFYLNHRTGTRTTYELNHQLKQLPDYFPIDDFMSRFTSLSYSSENTEARQDEITLSLVVNGAILDTVQCSAQGLNAWIKEWAKPSLDDLRQYLDRLNDNPNDSEARQSLWQANKEKHKYSFPLSLKGQGVGSTDGRWLILTAKQASPIQACAAWLKKKFEWKIDISRIGSSYSALVIDLSSREQITCPLSIHTQPTFVIHPKGIGFAVLQGPDSSASSSQSTIDWYSLPLGPAHHSVQQWCCILVAFGVPVALTMLWNLLRRKRRAPVAVPPHP